MYVTILANGSRGDVQPFIALANGLQRAGHHVRVAAGRNFRDLVTERDVEFAPLAGDVQDMLRSDEGRQLLESGANPITLFRQLARLAEPVLVRAMRQAYEAVRDADVILAGTNAFFAGDTLAEVTGLPLVYGSLGPMAPTRTAPSMLLPELPRPARWLGPLGYHGVSHRLALALYARLMRRPVNRARSEVFGLPPRGRTIGHRAFRHGPLYLNGFSQVVSPRPRDWSSTQQVTGYWFLDRGSAWEPSGRLLEFLAAGPPPVCVGFGSMNDRDPGALADLAVDALRRARQRGILLTGWGGLAAEQRWDDIFVLDQAPHDWLFRRVSAVVHHGGAGTTAAGLRAGRPTVVVPYMADQPYWGRRVQALGAGPTPIPRSRLTADGLAEAIFHAVTRPELRAAAERVGALIRSEDGVGRAVDLLERHLWVTRMPRVWLRSGRKTKKRLSAGHGG